MFYTLEQSIYDDYGATSDPEIPWHLSFLKGELLAAPLETPLVFTVNNAPDSPPGGISGLTVPAFSDALISVFENHGVDNLQQFDAVLINEETGQRWEDYKAVNIVGKIACASLANSEATEIARRPGDAIPLYNFHRLVIDPDKVSGQLIFKTGGATESSNH